MAIGDVTVDLLSRLGIRMEEETPNVFTDAKKLKALNDTSDELVALVDNAHLTELEELSDKVACTLLGGRLYQAFTTISGGSTNDVLGKLGITGVTVYDNGASAGKLADPYLKLINTRDEENTLKTGSADRPKYFVHNERVYIYCTTKTSATFAEVWYLRKPKTITVDLDPLIGSHLHDAWLSLAAAQLWRQEHKTDRSKEEMDIAILIIAQLNEKAKGK